MSVYDEVKRVAEAALSHLKDEKREYVSARELFEWVQQHADELNVDVSAISSSWGAYLTKAVNDEESLVDREPGKYGYILRSEPSEALSTASDELAPQESGELSETERRRHEQREQHLYQIMVEWLQAQDMRADNTSGTKRGGVWGNPDVVGIKLHDHILGADENIEVISVEAKTSLDNWRRDFFEAVSHKRFVHRAYYAFAFPSEEARVSLIPEYHEMRKYGERFRVGVLAIFLPPEAYNRLKSGTNVHEVSLEESRIEEVWPAIYDEPLVTEMSDFLRDVLELDRPTKVREFGTMLA